MIPVLLDESPAEAVDEEKDHLLIPARERAKQQLGGSALTLGPEQAPDQPRDLCEAVRAIERPDEVGAPASGVDCTTAARSQTSTRGSQRLIRGRHHHASALAVPSNSGCATATSFARMSGSGSSFSPARASFVATTGSNDDRTAAAS